MRIDSKSRSIASKSKHMLTININNIFECGFDFGSLTQHKTQHQSSSFSLVGNQLKQNTLSIKFSYKLVLVHRNEFEC